MRPRSDLYHTWLTTLKATAELLLRVNTPEQSAYADVAPPQDWGSAAMTIWAGEGEALRPRLKIAITSSDRQNETQEICPPTGLRTLAMNGVPEDIEEVVALLSSAADLRLANEWRGVPHTRFEYWARLFCAGVDGLSLFRSAEPWAARTLYHGGWGTYYFEFLQLNGGPSFALGEEFGHIAGPDLSEDTIAAVREFRLAPAIWAGASREVVSGLLLPALQVCVAAAESYPERG